MRKRPGKLTFLIGLIAVLTILGRAQTQTTAFTYQGKLTDGGNPANGSYDLQFALFDSLSGGNQIGSTLTRAATNVSGGIFTVQLDFGSTAFPSADRFLAIGVRPAGAGSFTLLDPRQQISSTPYAIRTISAASADGLSSACVSCVQDSQINSVAGSKVSGTIPVAGVPAGSTNYIQNTTTAQSGANFNIAGNGTVGNTLGIGRSPTSGVRLDSQGTIRSIDSVSTSILSQTTGGTNAWARFYMISPAQGWLIGTSQNFNGNQFYLNDDTFVQTRMSIQPNGGVITFPMPTTGGRILMGDPGCGANFAGLGFATTLSACSNYSLLGNGTHTFLNRPNGGGIFFREGNADQMAISAGGRVGIGTATPDSKLTIVGDGTNGFSLGTSGHVGFGGNARQNRDKGGLVKAMVFVTSQGVITRCYNGETGASLTGGTTSSGCGFSVNHFTTGNYTVNFGFRVDDRFISITTSTVFGLLNSSDHIAAREIRGTPPPYNKIDLITFPTHEDLLKVNSDFYLIVF